MRLGHRKMTRIIATGRRSVSSAPRARRIVVAHVPHPGDHASEHERYTLLEIARRLALLRDEEWGGLYDPARHRGRDLYFVPSCTLDSDEAAALGIRGPDDLFGGVVPRGFVATKAITHPLTTPAAAAPAGWNPAFAPQVADAVLTGYSAFSLDDAREAGSRLLARGPVRLKPVRASGGRGQSVARDAAGLQALLDAIDARELGTHGVVLEEDMQQVRTFSVGQVRVAGLLATYFGFQKLTRNNEGEEVYGGSDLTIVRGDFDALLGSGLTPEIHGAVEHARRYDAAVHACYPGFYASRSNYDILAGRDATGAWCSAVLEQSWRAGGATGPEIAALEAFHRDPARRQVRADCVELFGASPEPPREATVYFRGTDARLGYLTKYTLVQPA
jgi:hypothetical protein